MRELPILFTGEMVRAILDGSKAQTRRVVKLPGDADLIERHGDEWVAIWDIDPMHPLDHGGEPYTETLTVRCPYGGPGDRIWVRERQRVIRVRTLPEGGMQIRVRYEADGAESDWLPYPVRLKGTPLIGRCLAYGGYRESSRITLRVTDVRVERVQDISEDDARAEGCTAGMDAHSWWTAAQAFSLLWDSINDGRGYGWEANPWVWVVNFDEAGDA